MGYAEAIEQQMAALRVIESPVGLAQCGLMAEKYGYYATETYGRNYMEVRSTIAAVVSECAPYFVAASIVDLIERAAPTLPDGGFVAADFPTEYGFVYLEKPIDVGYGKKLRAFSWSAVIRYEGGKPGDSLNFVGTQIFVDDEAVRAPWLVSADIWTPSRGWLHSDGSNGIWGYLRVFLAFARQRILTTSSRPINNRQVRKRLAKDLKHEPLIRVVELRQREYQQRDESHDAHIEYTCQWLVRGHWRQQFFPGSGEHRPLWIAPHIKGPSDKPLKAPTITAYEVVR